MKAFRISLIIVLVMSVFVWMLFFLTAENQSSQYYPWDISTNARGHLQVFGLTIDETSIIQAKRQLRANAKIALLESTDQQLSLELDLGEHTFGIISGRLLANIDLDEAQKQELKKNNVKATRLDSGTIKMSLEHNDAIALLDRPINGLTFIPYGDFTVASILKFFGKPNQRIREKNQIEHFLYPEKGLEVILDDNGKEVFQYVSPKNFERLQKPLQKLKN